MLGYDVYITPVTKTIPFEYKCTIGTQVLSHLFRLEEQGMTKNIGDAHGYPFKYELPFSEVVSWLSQSENNVSGVFIINEQESRVNATNFLEGDVFDMSAFSSDDLMLVEAWDQS